MCNLCCAEDALESTTQRGFASFWWSPDSGLGLDVQAEGAAAEFKPARLRVRRSGEGDEAWSPWLSSEDLAGSMSALGTDVRWRFVPDEVKAWLSGGAWEPVLALVTDES